MTSVKPSDDLRTLPSIDALLTSDALSAVISRHGRDLVTYAARRVVDAMRTRIQEGKKAAGPDVFPGLIIDLVHSIARPTLKPVINATGVVLHTNLGRAPVGKAAMDEIARVSTGYCSVEFDLATGKRGERNSHVVELLRYLTGAADAAVVNNNAAALVLVLGVFAKKKEVIVSRSELIEIGGSFRIPEIMKTSGAKMVEVGATNRTRLSDYEDAITAATAVIFKAHTSNYAIKGFTEDVSARDLAALAKKHDLIMVYDIGSGLLLRTAIPGMETEPDVWAAIESGADLVTFSCDKLLGGPQAGIIAGRQDLVARCAKAPLMRALRVGKLTLAALGAACRQYLDDAKLLAENPVFAMISQTSAQLRARAECLAQALREKGVSCEIIESRGQFGGGSLPDAEIPSAAVRITPPGTTVRENQAFAERIFHGLLQQEKPILSILREGRILFDVLTFNDEDVGIIAGSAAFFR
jgi:L-seryl-tRNA(Ser) seleniumtransferase